MPRTTRTTVIGVDPGKEGGFAVLNGLKVVETLKMPDTSVDICNFFWHYSPKGAGNKEYKEARKVVVFLEDVSSSPQMGVVSAFKFGQGYGALRMAVVAVGLRLELVRPQVWQKYHGLIMKGRGLKQGNVDKKKRNRAKAQELFPNVEELFTGPQANQYGIADALLIADYGRNVLQKGK